jgi:hypothetical protein
MAYGIGKRRSAEGVGGSRRRKQNGISSGGAASAAAAGGGVAAKALSEEADGEENWHREKPAWHGGVRGGKKRLMI